MGGAVVAGHEAFHDLARHEGEARQAIEDLGIQDAGVLL